MHKKIKKLGHDLERIFHDIQFRHDHRDQIFLALPHKVRATLLPRLTKHVLADLLLKINDDELAETLEHLDPDEATDILQGVSQHRQHKVIALLTERLKKDVQILSEFDPNTAAGLMNLDYIQVEETDSLATVAKQFKIHEKRTGRLPAIIAMREGNLVGYVPGHELGFGKPAEPIKKYIHHIPSIRHNADKNKVINLFKAHPHNKIVVIGDRDDVMGIIYSDDILRVLEEQQSASLYDYAGVHDEESVADSTRNKIKHRYKWLIINLATAFFAAGTVSLFDETISKYVLLAVYMPIVAGMGGNAATQTLAVVVRGIALKQIDLKRAWPTLKRELGSSLANGLINGVIVALVVMIFNHDIKIAIILACAMIINLLVAGFFGTLVPLIMKRIGKDPATSATIFITTATDVLGFLVFLGLATIFL